MIFLKDVAAFGSIVLLVVMIGTWVDILAAIA